MTEGAKKKIKNVALNLLARREHSQKELQQKLKIRNFTNNEIAAILVQLEKEGWQSDQRFAENYTHLRISKGYGPRRIAQELQMRGLSEEVIQDVLNNFDENFWQDKLMQIYQKKFGKRPVNNQTEYAKQIRFLQFRGFILDNKVKKMLFNKN